MPASWKRFVLRGDVYRFRLPKGIGHEQHGERFGVVVQADEFLPRSVVIVAPTSRSARAASFRPEIDIGGESTRVLVEQIGAVDAQRLGDLMGHATPEEMWGIDEALATVLGLD
ncbi:MAG: mRNA interferase MazF [Actinomycetota bacterium]|nr:mRNA interferase MazF [Actinomycetota bacterium]